MQKVTKDLFLKLKALRPSVHAVSSYYGIHWKDDRSIEQYYLEIPNKHITFNTEKELQDHLKTLIASTASDLGFRFPETTSKLKIETGIKTEDMKD
jgi:hypothetical protein